jgi:outer membrane protein assembly factor BamB
VVVPSRIPVALAFAFVLPLVMAGCCTRPPGGGPPATESAYAESWSAVHADAANTDYSPVEVAADVGLVWEQRIEGTIRIGPLPWTINLGPTVDPEGRMYLTSTAAGCHLRALDGATGELVWCDPDLDLFTVVSSPLLDRDGRLFVADGAGMHALDRDGGRSWDAPLDGVPLSAQFTPDGHLLFVTHVGTLYVLDRDDGAEVVPPVALAPGVTWTPDAGMMACARGTEQCPSANTIAIDGDGRVFFTLWSPGEPTAGLRAMRYTGGHDPAVTPLWTNGSLPGGSASSPVLSADGSRVYVTDNVDSVHALDAATGETVWSYPIGYASGGSLSLAPDGLLMPAGGGNSPVMGLRDAGSEAELVWRRDDLLNRGIATQTAGGRAYVTVDAGSFRNELVVVDTADGTELDREPMSGTSVFSVGTTVGPDGTVYVPTIVGGVHAFRG